MNAPTEKERALANLRHLHQQMAGGQVKDSAQAKRIADGLLSPAIAKLEQAARRAPAAPVPQIAEVQDSLVAISAAIADQDDIAAQSMLRNLLSMLDAAPQPPEATVNQQLTVEAAPVQMPEPVAYQWLSTDNFRISGGPVSGAYWNKLYTEQQVRDLLAAHGIGKDKA